MKTRSIPIVGLASIAFLVAAVSNAHAGSYEVVACDAAGPSGANNSWVAETTHGGMEATVKCPTGVNDSTLFTNGNGLIVSHKSQPKGWTVPSGAAARFRFRAPDGAYVVSGRFNALFRSLDQSWQGESTGARSVVTEILDGGCTSTVVNDAGAVLTSAEARRRELEEFEMRRPRIWEVIAQLALERERSLAPWRREQECKRLQEEEAAVEAEHVRIQEQAIVFEAEHARLREQMIIDGCARLRRMAAEVAVAQVEVVVKAGEQECQSLGEKGSQTLETFSQRVEKAQRQITGDVKAGDQRLKKAVERGVARVDQLGKDAVRDLGEQGSRDRARLARETAEHCRRINAAKKAGVDRVHNAGGGV